MSNEFATEERMPETTATKRAGGISGDQVVVAGILIMVGVALLGQNLGWLDFGGIVNLRNWWALFFLIPIFGTGASIWRAYRETESLNRKARAQLGGLFFLTAIFIFFMLGLDWGRYWPIFLIVFGLSAILNSGGE